MINIYKYLSDTLEKTNVVSDFLFYDGDENTFITFYSYSEKEVFYSDDTNKDILIYFQIDIFNKEIDYKLIDKVKKIIVDSGFIYNITGPDLYHEDLELYQKPLRFLFNLGKIGGN